MFKKGLLKLLALLLSLTLIVILSDVLVGTLYNKKLYLPDEYERRYPYEGSIFAQKVFQQKERYVGRFENEGDYYINKKGYRGPNFSTIKPQDTIRVIIYGGSSVFDVGSDKNTDWPQKVERLLKEKGHDSVEVINAGIPGLASFDSVGRLLSEGHMFEPDYVVLYNTYNDFRYFVFENSLLRRFEPFVIDYRQEYHNDADEFLCRHWKTYLFLRTLYYEKNVPHENRFQRAGELAKRPVVHAIKQYKINIESFVDLARNIGAEPIIMTQGRMMSKVLKGDFDIEYSHDYLSMTYEAIEEAFNQSDNVLHKVSKDKNVRLIDSSKLISGKKENFIDIVHLSEQGGDIIAKSVADDLISGFCGGTYIPRDMCGGNPNLGGNTYPCSGGSREVPGFPWNPPFSKKLTTSSHNGSAAEVVTLHCNRNFAS